MLAYATVFAGFGGILAAVFAIVEGVAWPLGLALGAVIAVVHGVVCHSAEHIARVSPLRTMRLSITLSTFLAAASAAGALLAALALGGLALAADLPGDRLFDEAPLYFGLGAGSYLIGVAFHYLSAARREAVQSAARALEAELAAVEAELRALSAKVNPHFLFNALGSVAALTATDPQAGRRMCLDLAELMRFQLRVGDKALVPLEEELDMVRRYLAIEGVRFGDRMSVAERVDPASLSWPVPPLLLQPLVENAVKHGVATSSEASVVEISARLDRGALEVIVENSVGAARSGASKGGVGIDLVGKRLAAVYGGRAWLRTEAGPGRFTASIRLPGPEGKA
jgi:two-component system, LytTR family, sensor histidine kinase AlgZ